MNSLTPYTSQHLTAVNISIIHEIYFYLCEKQIKTSMKKLLIFFSAITISISAFSQSPAFEKSDLVFNAGIGFGSFLYGTGYSTTLPAISLSGEYGIVDDLWTDRLNLGVGGYIGYASSKYESAWFSGTYRVRTNYTLIGARGAFHYTFVDNLDVYAGALLGYNIVSITEESVNLPIAYSKPRSRAVFYPYIGARYYFSDKFGVMGELGGGIAYVNLGVTLKF